jgi:RNA polymerase sigma-70 factor (ECF subfamily)
MMGGDLPKMLPRLWAFALRICGNQRDAEDLVQLACLRGVEKAKQSNHDMSALCWMFSILHSTWVNDIRVRSLRNRAGPDWDDELLETITNPDATDRDAQASIHHTLDAVQQLAETQRTVLLLVAVERFSYKEAARILDVPVGTVMSRLSRARHTIGALVGAQGARK